MKVSIPYLVSLPGAKGLRWYWQPSSDLRAQGWASVNYQKPVETPDGPMILPDEAAIFRHAKARNAMLAGTPRAEATPAAAVTLGAWMDQFMLDPRYFEPLSDAAQRQYRGNFQVLRDDIGDLAPGAIGRADVLSLYEEYKTTRGHATAYAVIASLKRLYNWAETRELSVEMLRNPAEGLKLTRPKPRKTRWHDAEIAALIALCDAGCPAAGLDPDPAMADAIALSYYTALRPRDMLRLGPRNRRMLRATLDGKTHEREGIVLDASSKTDIGSAVPIHALLLARLDRCARPEMAPWVLTPAGKPYSSDWFSHRFAAWRDALARMPGWEAVGVKTHRDLRRSAVCKLGELGMVDETIAAITGHSYATVKTILETYLVRGTAAAMRGILAWEERG